MGSESRIILASGSPRRRELLEKIGIEDFTVLADTSEEVITPGLSPEEQVIKLSLQKALNVAKKCNKNDIILAADTIVYLDSKPLGKPESYTDAISMLEELSGRKHSVYTGVTLLRDDKVISHAERTDVSFREVSGSEIEAYVKTGEPMDKAGSYAAQGRASIFIERIEGDFFNVMGLPLCKVSQMLKEFEVRL